MNNFIELTEITKKGYLWWKKEETEPLFLSPYTIENLRNRKRTGTIIETDSAMYEVREHILDVINKVVVSSDFEKAKANYQRPICPHCGHAHLYAPEWIDDDGIWICDECEKPFKYDRRLFVSYQTSTLNP